MASCYGTGCESIAYGLGIVVPAIGLNLTAAALHGQSDGGLIGFWQR
jgi:hypothetical protein